MFRMSKKARWCLCLVLLVQISGVLGELHRAKKLRTNVNNNGVPPIARFPPGAFSDHDNEATFIDGSGKDLDDLETSFIGHSRETWIFSLVSASLVGLSGIFPLLVIPLEAGKALRKGVPAARLKLLLSFAVGGLLGDVFLHLLPEAWAHLDKHGHDHEAHLHLGLWVLAGIFCFLIIEKAFPEEEDQEEEEEGDNNTEHITNPQTSLPNGQTRTTQEEQEYSSPVTRSRSKQLKNKNKLSPSLSNGTQNGHLHTNGSANGHIANGKHSHSNGSAKKESEKKEESSTHIKTSGWLNLMANIIDNFTHGLAVAGSYCISTKTGLITTVAVLLHEVPHEVGDFAILLRSGFDRWKAAKAQLLTATGGLFGAIVALTAESAEKAGDSTAWILPFTSGGFIYIALVTVVPDLLKETDLKQSTLQVVLIIVGIFMVAGVTLLCE